MARHYDGALTIMDSAGNVLAARDCLIYSDRAATTQVTTVTLYDGTTVTAGKIPSGIDGRVRFAETTNGYNGLYVKAPDGQTYFVVAEEYILAGGGGGGVSLSAANSWTGVQTFSTDPAFNNNAIPQAKVNGLGASLTAAANPVQRADTANQTAMLALTANVGDWTKRTDAGTVWVLMLGSDPTTLGNWVNLGAGSSTFTRSYANAEANLTYTIVGLSTMARPSSRTDLVFLWITTDGLTPVNKTSNDVWLNAAEAPA